MLCVSYKISVLKPEGKRPLGTTRRKWEDNRDIEWEGVEWIHVAQDRDQWKAHVYTVMNLRVPKRQGISSLAE
jgi:hypothetical protein